MSHSPATESTSLFVGHGYDEAESIQAATSIAVPERGRSASDAVGGLWKNRPSSSEDLRRWSARPLLRRPTPNSHTKPWQKKLDLVEPGWEISPPPTPTGSPSLGGGAGEVPELYLPPGAFDARPPGQQRRLADCVETVAGGLAMLPGLLISLLLNLMLCVPFGLSFFPAEWSSLPVPRTVGISMFLFSL